VLTIDADAHVLETEQTWEYMDGAARKYRPQIVGATSGDSKDEYWMVDGTLRLKSGNVGRNTPQASREMRDVSIRLKHMDELGVTIQVLYPTLFLIPLTPRPEVELALSRSYNRWLADIWKQEQTRVRWAAVVPAMTMDQALAEARFGKENGACGIFMRGTEGDLLLSDPYFFSALRRSQPIGSGGLRSRRQWQLDVIQLLQIRDRRFLQVQTELCRRLSFDGDGPHPRTFPQAAPRLP
jgi:predicted TIM-barrel fold metal-dependent hydrolase